ncbi:MAG: hypothetical protein MUC36_14265 [Planctomycetes bacterium]|jgi:hypothetical protein|nr:hypothetical protein [Planctomycetota bacterium]
MASADFAVVMALASVCQGLVGQATCNHTGRKVQIEAGDRNFSNAPCGNFSIVVAGSNIQGPANCLRGGAHYAGTVYACEGIANLTNCKNQGFKVAIETYSNGGCPDLTGLIPGASFASWMEVPAAVRKGLQCIPPKKKDTFDWSASTTDCPTGTKQRPAVGTVRQGGSGAFYTVAEGSVYPSHGSRNPFLTPYDSAQSSSPAVVSGLLGSLVIPLHPRFAGAVLGGVVTTEHVIDGVSFERSVSVEGSVLSNGRFDLNTSYGIVQEGRAVSHGKWLTFDGNAMGSTADGSENGNLWPATGVDFALRFSQQASDVIPLYQWVRDPFEIPWTDSVSYVEATDATTAVISSRMSVALGGGLDKEYEIDLSGPVVHPIAMRVYDLTGAVREETRFKDYRAVSPGKWRPFQVTRTTWLAPARNQDRVTVTLSLTAAKLIDEAAQVAVPKGCADSHLWFVWL